MCAMRTRHRLAFNFWISFVKVNSAPVLSASRGQIRFRSMQQAHMGFYCEHRKDWGPHLSNLRTKMVYIFGVYWTYTRWCLAFMKLCIRLSSWSSQEPLMINAADQNQRHLNETPSNIHNIHDSRESSPTDLRHKCSKHGKKNINL